MERAGRVPAFARKALEDCRDFFDSEAGIVRALGMLVADEYANRRSVGAIAHDLIDHWDGQAVFLIHPFPDALDTFAVSRHAFENRVGLLDFGNIGNDCIELGVLLDLAAFHVDKRLGVLQSHLRHRHWATIGAIGEVGFLKLAVNVPCHIGIEDASRGGMRRDQSEHQGFCILSNRPDKI